MKKILITLLFLNVCYATPLSKKLLLESLQQNKETQVSLHLQNKDKNPNLWFKASQELAEIKQACATYTPNLHIHLPLPEKIPLAQLIQYLPLKEQLVRLEHLALQYGITFGFYYPNVDLYTLLEQDLPSPDALYSQDPTSSPSPFPLCRLPGHTFGPMEETPILDWERAVQAYEDIFLETLHELLAPLSTLQSLEEQKRIHAHLIDAAQAHYTLCFFQFTEGKLDYLHVLEAQEELLQERLIELDLYCEQQTALMRISHLLENR